MAEKMNEFEEVDGVPKGQCWAKLTDVCRMMVYCKSVDEVKTLFKQLLNNPGYFNILRFKPRFSGFLKDMIINFNFMGIMICEM